MFNAHQAHGYSRPSFKRAMLNQAASGVSNPSPTSIARNLDGSCFEPVPLPFKVKRMPTGQDSGFKLTRRHTLEDTTQNRGGGSRGSSDGDGSKSFSSYQRSKSQEVVVFKREIQNTSTKDHSDTKIRSPKKSTTSIQPKTKKASAKRAGRVNSVQANQSLSRYDRFWTSEGCCLYHPTIRLAVKTGGVWDLLTEECPKCKLDF